MKHFGSRSSFHVNAPRQNEVLESTREIAWRQQGRTEAALRATEANMSRQKEERKKHELGRGVRGRQIDG